MRKVILVAVLVLGLASAAWGGDYLPLKEGNSWSYSLSTGLTMVVRVAGFQDVKGVRCAVVETVTGDMPASREYLAIDSEGVKAYKAELAGQELVYDQPVLRVKLPFKEGDAWTARQAVGGVAAVARAQSVGREEVRTGAGTFDCIKVQSVMAVGDARAETCAWYAEGVGLVQQTLQAGGQTLTARLAKTNVKAQSAGVTPTPAQVNVAGDPAQPNPAVHPPTGRDVTGDWPGLAGSSVSSVQSKCSGCGAKLAADVKFCGQCGAKVVPAQPPAQPDKCPACNKPVKPDAKFCSDCGAKLQSAASVVPSAGPSPVPASSDKAPPVDPTRTVDGRAGPALERYQSADGKVVLFRPKGWDVEEGALFGEGTYAVTVMDPEENAGVLFITFPTSAQVKDSVALAGVCLTALGQEFSDMKVARMASSPDRARTTAEVSLTDEGKKLVGHMYFFRTERLGSVYALMAREDLWEQQRATLTAVCANLAFAPEGVKSVLEQGRKLAERTPPPDGRALSPAAMIKDAAARPGRQLVLQTVAAPDQSLTVQIPQGWDLKAGQLQFLAVNDPQKKTCGIGSVRHTVLVGAPAMPGMLSGPYQSPPQALASVLELGQVGRDLQVLAQCPADQVVPDLAQALQPLAAQGLQVDVRVMHVRFVSLTTGQALRGLFTVNCTTSPMGGVWQCMVDGGWAADSEFDDYLPLYLRIGKSVNANQQWVGQEMNRRHAHQQQLNRNLQTSIAESNQAFDRYLGSLRDAGRSRDYTNWAFSQTTLGQGTWVAENEGAKVYQTDSWGIQGPDGRVDHPAFNTTNFTGRSPWGQLEQVDTRAEYEKHLAGSGP